MERWRRTVDKWKKRVDVRVEVVHNAADHMHVMRWPTQIFWFIRENQDAFSGGWRGKKNMSRLHTFILPLPLKSHVHRRKILGCFQLKFCVDCVCVLYHILCTQTFYLKGKACIVSRGAQQNQDACVFFKKHLNLSVSLHCKMSKQFLFISAITVGHVWF